MYWFKTRGSCIGYFQVIAWCWQNNDFNVAIWYSFKRYHLKKNLWKTLQILLERITSLSNCGSLMTKSHTQKLRFKFLRLHAKIKFGTSLLYSFKTSGWYEWLLFYSYRSNTAIDLFKVDFPTSTILFCITEYWRTPNFRVW